MIRYVQSGDEAGFLLKFGGAPDEDYPPRYLFPPVAAQYVSIKFFLDDGNDIGTYRNTAVDEEFWLRPATPLQYNWNRAFLDSTDTPVPPFVPDEDYWQNAVRPLAPAAWTRAFIADGQDTAVIPPAPPGPSHHENVDLRRRYLLGIRRGGPPNADHRRRRR
jgi:hypothetical protein